MPMLEAPIPASLITPLNKGIGALDEAVTPERVGQLGWNLLREEVSLPAAVLLESRLTHNRDWMQRYADRRGVRLAPHGKTTMAPGLFRRQLAAGAWGITVATAHQALVAHHHGVPRVLMANQLVGRRNVEIVAELLRDPGFEFFCLVDSAANVDQLGRFFAASGQSLPVLLELGVTGGRTGVREVDQELALREAIDRWPGTIRLAGVEVYEGVLTEESEIRRFLGRAVHTFRRLAEDGCFARTPPLLSGAGSAWYDVVAEEFARAGDSGPVDVVLRPGCYLTHDVGLYRLAQEEILRRDPVARGMGEGLLPALQVWAYVQSIPEPGRAIVGLGKRDAAFDAGLPVPTQRHRPGEAAPTAAPEHWEVAGMMDQHAYLSISTDDSLAVGDMIAFDISHPCLTFDRWRHLLVVDDEYTVVNVVQTFF